MNLNVRRVVVLGVIVSLSVLLNPMPAQAQGELRVVDSSAWRGFPEVISFSLTAESNVDITDVRLHYKVLKESFVDVTSETVLEFEPSTTVELVWDWDMVRTGGLPPGTGVQYWWTVKDASGGQVETSPAIILFDDERFEWQSRTQGMVTLYWYEGGQSFTDEIMLAIRDALNWLEADSGAILLEPIEIYIYASSHDLQASMIFPQEWTGGVAYPTFGCIAIGINPGNLEWGKKAIVHELTHLVVHQITLSPYGGIPTWLDEGLAMRSEGALTPFFLSTLDQAIETDSLISVQSLSSPFSAISALSYLSYAESYKVVDYLITTYGKDRMLELLETFGAGASYDGALTEVYGLDTDNLNRRWQAYVTGSEMHPVIISAIAGLATVLLLLLSLATESWTWRRTL